MKYTLGSMWLHAAPCTSRLSLKDLHADSVVFEVYTVAPCGSIQLHAAPVIFADTRLFLVFQSNFSEKSKFTYERPVPKRGMWKKL